MNKPILISGIRKERSNLTLLLCHLSERRLNNLARIHGIAKGPEKWFTAERLAIHFCETDAKLTFTINP